MQSTLAMGVGLILGLAFGLVASATQSAGLMAFATGIEPVGTAFVNLIRMVVVPLVATTVFTGVVRLGDPRRLGRLGAITLGFFWSTTLVAIVIGMTVMRLLLPFAPPTVPPAAEPGTLAKLPGTVDFLLSLIPTNVIDVAARGALLPLIVFTVLFAAAASTLNSEAQARLTGLADAATQTLVKLVYWILWTAPVGVFALAAAVTAKSGWSMLQNLAIFVGGVIAGLLVFFFGVYLPLITYLGKITPARFLRACVGPATIAFSTTSSAAALPALFESADELRLSPSVSGFVLSLGAAINRTGSALFQGAAIMFLASLYHVTLPPAALGGAIFATFLVSQTVASVPSASIVSLAPALGTLGIPLAGLGILLGVDRIPDMFRTATQVTGHLGAAVVADRLTLTPVPSPLQERGTKEH
ncbi:MAG: dicarboxylate/amino acid:cation symporter [Gemmatimonadetes bacterium]|nr:dicarboxylate/amino acid:cation symporter [Gemmatimonadota bacterium]